MLNSLKKKHPEFYPLVWQAYSSGTNLLFGNEIIQSLTGLQQGDVLGPYLFSLSIQELISNLKSSLNIWYLDDGTLGGDPNDVLKDWKKILVKGKEIGLSLNPGKCELYTVILHHECQSLEEFQLLAPNIKVISSTE